LNNNNRKILGHFVRTCNLLVTRIITEDDLKEVQERLEEMTHLIESTYQSVEMSQNK
jgi:hypothetical protein